MNILEKDFSKAVAELVEVTQLAKQDCINNGLKTALLVRM